MVSARIFGSSVIGMPALTSSICAPAATWPSVSEVTRVKSPAAISAASSLRPVGLMRSPITQNGRSKPMTTSLVAELMTVSVMESKSFSLTCGGGERRFIAGRLRGATRLAILHNAGGVDDFVHELLLTIGHDVDPGDALDLA